MTYGSESQCPTHYTPQRLAAPIKRRLSRVPLQSIASRLLKVDLKRSLTAGLVECLILSLVASRECDRTGVDAATSSDQRAEFNCADDEKERPISVGHRIVDRFIILTDGYHIERTVV